jgi:hypothetical protein
MCVVKNFSLLLGEFLASKSSNGGVLNRKLDRDK